MSAPAAPLPGGGGRPRARPARVRVYFDADVLGLAKVLAPQRSDFTFPGDPGATIGRRERPACPVAPGAKDRDWIPVVAQLGWLIVTRDRRIQDHRAEIDAVRTHSAKMINLAGADAGTTWAQLEVFMSRWHEIDGLAEQPGPFIYIANRTTRLHAIDLAA